MATHKSILHVNLLLLLTVCILTVPLASAYSLSNVQIIPNETIMQGDEVTVRFTLTFEPVGNYTFDPTHSILLATALNDPHWSRITVLDGFASKPYDIGTGAQRTLSGNDLAYTSTTFLKINITLSGIAEPGSSTSRVPLLKIVEIGKNGEINSGTTTTYTRTVIQPADLKSSIYLAEKDLKTFQEHIQKAQSIGLDASASEQQEQDIAETISYVKSFKDTDYLEGRNLLNSARSAIAEGEDLLQKTYTQEEIRKARVPLDNTDTVLSWFSSNESTKNYPGLIHIEVNRTTASALIANASASMSTKSYSIAIAEAKRGFEVANNTYYESIALQTKAQDPVTPLKENLHILVAVIGIIVLYFLFRRRKEPKKELEK